MLLRQSYCGWIFAGRGVPDGELLRQAKAIGYAGVELIGESLWSQAQDLGLSLVSHQGQPDIHLGWNDPALHSALEAETHRRLALAQKHGILNLVVFSGNRREGLSDEAGLENTALGLSRVAPAAEEAGVTLLLELLNSKRDHAGYQCDQTAWGAEVCRRVGSPRVKLLYDIYHLQVMEGDLIHTMEAHHGEIGHYHTAGNPGRRDLDQAQEISYPPLLRAIAATGYTGFIGHEFAPKGDPVAALRSAYDLCRFSLSQSQGDDDDPG